MRRTVPFINESLITRQNKKSGINDDENLPKDALSPGDQIAPDCPSRAPSQANTSKLELPKESSGPQVKVTACEHQTTFIDWKPINNGHCLRININGKLDFQLRKEWQRFLQETATSDVGQFEFNLRQTPELSLTGLGLLLLFKDQKQSQRQDIKLSHCNRQIHELLQWTGMDKFFLIQAIPGSDARD